MLLRDLGVPTLKRIVDSIDWEATVAAYEAIGGDAEADRAKRFFRGESTMPAPKLDDTGKKIKAWLEENEERLKNHGLDDVVTELAAMIEPARGQEQAP